MSILRSLSRYAVLRSAMSATDSLSNAAKDVRNIRLLQKEFSEQYPGEEDLVVGLDEFALEQAHIAVWDAIEKLALAFAPDEDEIKKVIAEHGFPEEAADELSNGILSSFASFAEERAKQMDLSSTD